MKFIDLATQSALQAGDSLLGYFGTTDSYELKSPKSIVTEADTRSEELIIGKIRSFYPGHGFVAEESGENINDSAPNRNFTCIRHNLAAPETFFNE